MRDRLIELIKQGDKTFADKYTGEVMLHIDELYDFLADYLLDNDVTIKPPQELFVMMGGVVFVTDEGEADEVLLTGVGYDYTGEDVISTYDDQDEKVRNYRFSDFDKTVFLTKEEAEKALKGGAE